MGNEQIWAPWRLEYVQGKDQTEHEDHPPVLPGGDPDCFLCRDVCTPDMRRAWVVARGENVLVVLNRYPYSNGHLLVAPQQHVARLDGLAEPVQLEISTTITRMIGALERTIRPDGFNVGLNLGRVAGAGLPGHLHWHIVPRWNGDTNFMPVTAGIHVIPQSLDALWDLLTEELRTGEPAPPTPPC